MSHYLKAFGEVYSGDWRMSQVAIKVVKPQGMSASQLEDFKAEIHIMKNMRPHPNLIQVKATLEKTNEI